MPEAVLLLVAQGDGGRDVDLHAAATFIIQLAVDGRDGAEGVEPVVLVEHLEEVDEQVVGPAGEGVAQHVGLAVTVDGGPGRWPGRSRAGRARARPGRRPWPG